MVKKTKTSSNKRKVTKNNSKIAKSSNNKSNRKKETKSNANLSLTKTYCKPNITNST